MASNKEYLDFILNQLSDLEDITYRKMMGEYIIYYKGKIVGGIYDDRLLVKPVKSAKEFAKPLGLHIVESKDGLYLSFAKEVEI